MQGVTVAFSSDFRQTLAVILRVTNVDELKAYLKFSISWTHIKVLKLSTNKVAHILGDDLSKQFSYTVLKVGEGGLDIKHEGGLNPSEMCTLVSSERFPKYNSKLHKRYLVVRKSNHGIKEGY